jgi:hypothetical protein
MNPIHRRQMERREFLQSALVASTALSAALSLPEIAFCEPAAGVELKAPVASTAEERNRQADIWVMEITLRPLRLVKVELPNQKNVNKDRLVWYICYKAVNRPIEVKASQVELSASDKELARKTQVFVPEFTLVTDDTETPISYIDRVMPAAQPIINKRERGKYLNSIEVVQPVPPVVPYDKPGGADIRGVAMWRGVDPAADRLTLYMTGFSNGYVVTKAPDGTKMVWRKTLIQKFWRPGDEIDQDEREIHYSGKPEWDYCYRAPGEQSKILRWKDVFKNGTQEGPGVKP